jgi:acid stress-induced BolA-like protein IbaG/YrbA
MDKNNLLNLLNEAQPELTFDVEIDGSHFHITAVGDLFENLSRLKRQQLMNKIVSPYVKSGEIHAVTYTLRTQKEQKDNNG